MCVEAVINQVSWISGVHSGKAVEELFQSNAQLSAFSVLNPFSFLILHHTHLNICVTFILVYLSVFAFQPVWCFFNCDFVMDDTFHSLALLKQF